MEALTSIDDLASSRVPWGIGAFGGRCLSAFPKQPWERVEVRGRQGRAGWKRGGWPGDHDVVKARSTQFKPSPNPRLAGPFLLGH